MADDHARDELDQLRTEFMAFRAQVEAERRQRSPHRRLPRRFLPLALVALLVVLTPLATFAAGFTDLNAGSPHNDNIAAIAAAGITKGCNPPDYTNYCPNDKVTREEMASFLARTAGLGTNPPVANAKTAQTATNATNATNADKLGGLAAGDLLRVAQTSAGPIGDTTVPGTGTYQAVRTTAVVAPGPGFLLVTGSALLFSGTTSKYLRVSSAGAVSPEATVQLGNGAGQVMQASLSQTFVFPVTAAGTKTVALEVQSYNSAVTVRGATLIVVFVPFGYNGGATLEP